MPSLPWISSSECVMCISAFLVPEQEKTVKTDTEGGVVAFITH